MIQKRFRGSDFECAMIWSSEVAFPAHAHDEFVFSCNVSGHETLELDGRQYRAPEKYTTLYNPGQVQSGQGTNCIVSLYVDTAGFKSLIQTDAAVDVNTSIVNDVALYRMFIQILSGILSLAPASEIETAVLNVIGHVVDNYTISSEIEYPNESDWRVEHIKNILLGDLSRIPSLEELAHEVGLGRIALLRMFSNAIGTPPIAWQRHQRIARARELLKEGMSPISTANELGFADQAHFTRHFGIAYGITPAKFKAG